MLVEFRVIPNAARTGISGTRDGVMVLRVMALLADGRANRAAREYLVRRLGVAKSSVRLVSGEKSRHKKFEIVGWTSSLEEALLDHPAGDAR